MKPTEQYFLLLRRTEGGPRLREWNPKALPFNWKLLSSSFLWYCLLRWTKIFVHLNESYRVAFLWYCLLHSIRWFKLLSQRMKSSSMTNQLKATEQYFPVWLLVSFISKLYNVALKCTNAAVNQIKATLHYFTESPSLFIPLSNVEITILSEDHVVLVELFSVIIHKEVVEQLQYCNVVLFNATKGCSNSEHPHLSES